MSSKSKHSGNVSGRGRRNKQGGNPQSKLLGDSKSQPPQSKLLDYKYQQKSSVPAPVDLNIEPVQTNQSKLSDIKDQQSLSLAQAASKKDVSIPFMPSDLKVKSKTKSTLPLAASKKLSAGSQIRQAETALAQSGGKKAPDFSKNQSIKSSEISPPSDPGKLSSQDLPSAPSAGMATRSSSQGDFGFADMAIFCSNLKRKDKFFLQGKAISCGF